MPVYATAALFDLSRTLAAPLLRRYEYPWQALGDIAAFIAELGPRLPAEEYERRGENIWIARSAGIAPSASVAGPCIIGPNTELRPGAYLRGGTLVGEGAVVGNSTELKNAILFDRVQVPHYNYVGDSILGLGAHLGAGAITSNVKSDNTDVVINCGAERIPTHRRKVGAMVGDGAEVGCNSVLCPGCVLGRGARVYPLCMVRGTVPENHIFKAAGSVIPREDRQRAGGKV